MAKKRASKKLLIIIFVLLILILALVGAFVFYNSTQPKPEKVFRNYIEWGLRQNQFAFEEKSNGTGTETTSTAKNDVSKKEFKFSSIAKCEGTNTQISEGNNKITLNVSYAQIGANLYGKINSIDGFVNINGTNKELAAGFQNVKGKWVEIEVDNKGLASLLENNLATYDTIVLAPTYNTKQLADYIINNKVFSYTDFKKNDNKYTFNFVSDKNAYEKFLKDNFPNLKNQDIILGNIFGEKSQIISDITVDIDGQFTGQVVQSQNMCALTFNKFIGEGITGLSSEIGSNVRYLEYSTVGETTVESSVPANKFYSEIVW